MVVTGTRAIGRYRTQAIGTTAEILVTDAGMTGAAAAVLEEGTAWIDLLASRFREDSELSRLNASAGRRFGASPDLIEALHVALRAARVTEGRVTPTVGAALCALGYDRDFSAVVEAGISVGADTGLPEPCPVPDWHRVQVDAVTGIVELPAGVHIDLGSTAKAWAADRIATAASERLGCGVLVSLGGDVCVSGPPPDGGWAVALADRCVDEPATAHAVVSITGGGLATSGTATRTWMRGGRPVHHLIDPRTGLPAAPCWTSVSVAAGTCTDANTAATAAMVMGPDAPGWLGARSLPALLVPVSGTPVTVAGWPTAEAA